MSADGNDTDGVFGDIDNDIGDDDDGDAAAGDDEECRW